MVSVQMNYILYHPKAANKTGPALIQELGIYGGPRPPEYEVDILIRYGSTEPAPKSRIVVNSAEAISRAVDKRASLFTFLVNDVNAPQPEDYPSSLPAVGRKKRHECGHGFWLCLQEADVRAALEKGADYFIPYIPTRRIPRSRSLRRGSIHAAKGTSERQARPQPVAEKQKDGLAARALPRNSDGVRIGH